ncbi:MAG: hypothetical protein M3X11_12245, partial [Acidobacteriota bacterium]|nr:hypothetical protein [Acidobacteriota bacterium]
GLSALTAVIGGGACAYLWLRRIVGDGVACAAAVFYTALPYHLIVDLYIRGALAELFAFIWMPLALYFGLRFADRPRLACLGLATSYALLIVSHLPTALIFTPLPLGYAWFMAKPDERRRHGILTIYALGLGVGLSAVYLVPAIALRRFVSMQEMQRPVTYFGNWFLFSGSAWRELNTQITLVSSASVVLAICFFAFAKRSGGEPVKRESKFWLWVSLLAFVMMIPGEPPGVEDAADFAEHTIPVSVQHDSGRLGHGAVCDGDSLD